MEYVVYKQNPPITTGRRDRNGFAVVEANLTEMGVIDVPSGKCPIEYARDHYDLTHPLVSAVNGYTDEGKVRLYLQ